MLHVIHGQSVLESFFHFIRYNLNIIYSRMDRKINEKFKHCGICNGNIAYTACVAYPINLCISPCRNSFIWWSDNHEIVKYQNKRNTIVLPKCYTLYQERCKNYCHECQSAIYPSCISFYHHERHISDDLWDIGYQERNC